MTPVKSVIQKVEVISPAAWRFSIYHIHIFAGVWKCAKVTTLFKDGDKSLKDNYRPISILPNISKIIQRSAHIQLSSFLGRKQIIITITVWLPTKAFNFHCLNHLYRSSPRKYGQRMRDENSVPGPSQGV